jgi:hypothetical protein
MERIKVIDPPQGWKYGFPKPIPDAVVNFRQWLIDNGYPERLIDEYGEPLLLPVLVSRR